jgi:predicted O-methyltransferase YrrM
MADSNHPLKTRILRFAGRHSSIPGIVSRHLRERRSERAERRADATHLATFDPGAAIRRQEAVFRSLGLDRERGVAAHARFAATFPSLQNSGFSEHSILFAALACDEARAARVERILEVGTYDGVNGLLLAHLFPSARVTTIDLPDDHPVFAASYRRQDQDERRRFVERRDATLRLAGNVDFRRTSSVALTLSTPGPGERGYDLVWVDGAHGYPVCAIDVTNAVRLVAGDGLLLCDDVYEPVNTSPASSDPIYRSIASFETLSAFEREGLLAVTLVDKRLDGDHLRPSIRKFVAVCRRLSTGPRDRL